MCSSDLFEAREDVLWKKSRELGATWMALIIDDWLSLFHENKKVFAISHTEAAVDLARLAGCAPVAVICEVLHDDGSPARVPYLEMFAEEHRIAMVSVAQVVEHRERSGSELPPTTVA